MGEERETLTIRQAATLLGVHPNTVRNRIKAGVYQAEKVVTERGETYIIPRYELAQDLTTNRVPSASHSQSLPDVREAMQAMLEPFVKELGNVREELGRERERREWAERRVGELERQLGAPQEPQNAPESPESSDRVGTTEEPGRSGNITAILPTPTDHLPIWMYVAFVISSAALYFLGTAVPVLLLLTYTPVFFGLWLGLKRRGRPYWIYTFTAAWVGFINFVAFIIEGWIIGELSPALERPSQWPMFLFFMGLLPSLMFGAGALFGDAIKRKMWPVALTEPTISGQDTVDTRATGMSIRLTVILGVIPIVIGIVQILLAVVQFIVSRGP